MENAGQLIQTEATVHLSLPELLAYLSSPSKLYCFLGSEKRDVLITGVHYSRIIHRLCQARLCFRPSSDP